MDIEDFQTFKIPYSTLFTLIATEFYDERVTQPMHNSIQKSREEAWAIIKPFLVSHKMFSNREDFFVSLL